MRCWLAHAVQKPDAYITMTGEYADDLNRAYGDVCGLIHRACEYANVCEQTRLHGHAHDGRHRERVSVREWSLREYDDVRAARSPKIGFQSP